MTMNDFLSIFAHQLLRIIITNVSLTSENSILGSPNDESNSLAVHPLDVECFRKFTFVKYGYLCSSGSPWINYRVKCWLAPMFIHAMLGRGEFYCQTFMRWRKTRGDLWKDCKWLSRRGSFMVKYLLLVVTYTSDHKSMGYNRRHVVVDRIPESSRTSLSPPLVSFLSSYAAVNLHRVLLKYSEYCIIF